jgi:hypothetical protein
VGRHRLGGVRITTDDDGKKITQILTTAQK